MEEKIDYLNVVKDKIEEANLLSSVLEEDKELAYKLLLQRRKVKKENGFFAEMKIQKIDKKIEKLKLKKTV